MKNRAIVRLLSASVLISMLLTGTGFAVSEETLEQAAVMKKEATLTALQDDILVKDTKEVDLDVVTEVKNLDRYQEAVKEELPEMSDLELAKNIMHAVGYDDDVIQGMSTEKILETLTYTEITKSDMYIKQTAQGEKIQLSKLEFDKSVERARELENYKTIKEAFSADWEPLPDITEYPEDGYIELSSIANKYTPTYALPGRDYFILQGIAKWVKNPFWWRKDYLVIATSGVPDYKYKSSGEIYHNYYCYNCFEYYHHTDQCYINEQSDHYQSKMKVYNPSTNGFVVEGELLCPRGEGHEYTDFVDHSKSYNIFYGWYGISITDDISNQVAYFHQMVGVADNISISVGVSASGPNISVSAGIGTTLSEYKGIAFSLYHGINYK